MYLGIAIFRNVSPVIELFPLCFLCPSLAAAFLIYFLESLILVDHFPEVRQENWGPGMGESPSSGIRLWQNPLPGIDFVKEKFLSVFIPQGLLFHFPCQIHKRIFSKLVGFLEVSPQKHALLLQDSNPRSFSISS